MPTQTTCKPTEYPRYFVSYCLKGGGNPFGHASVLLSIQPAADQPVEVVDILGYFSGSGHANHSFLGKITSLFEKRFDLTGAHGVWKSEPSYDYDLGGLKGVTVEVCKDKFEATVKQFKIILQKQNAAINEHNQWIDEYNNQCKQYNDLVRRYNTAIKSNSDETRLLDLNRELLAWNVNSNNTDIKPGNEKVRKYNVYASLLTRKKEKTLLKRDATTRLKLEKVKGLKRLEEFHVDLGHNDDIVGKKSTNCKTKAREILRELGIGKKALYVIDGPERLTYAIPISSGPLQDFSIFANGTLRPRKSKSTHRVTYSRLFDEVDSGLERIGTTRNNSSTQLYWTTLPVVYKEKNEGNDDSLKIPPDLSTPLFNQWNRVFRDLKIYEKKLIKNPAYPLSKEMHQEIAGYVQGIFLRVRDCVVKIPNEQIEKELTEVIAEAKKYARFLKATSTTYGPQFANSLVGYSVMATVGAGCIALGAVVLSSMVFAMPIAALAIAALAIGLSFLIAGISICIQQANNKRLSREGIKPGANIVPVKKEDVIEFDDVSDSDKRSPKSGPQ